MLLNSFLHQRGDDCTSQAGKAEKGGRHSFIIKFAFPPFFVHLITRKSRKMKERKAHTEPCFSASGERQNSLLFVFCCYFHAASRITQVRTFQFGGGAQQSRRKHSRNSTAISAAVWGTSRELNPKNLPYIFSDT